MLVPCKLLDQFLNMPNIPKKSLEGVVFIINGCKLLTILQRVFTELNKVHVQELANQSRFNGAL